MSLLCPLTLLLQVCEGFPWNDSRRASQSGLLRLVTLKEVSIDGLSDHQKETRLLTVNF